MPGTMRPGDVLAHRYRLVDLLSESRGGRFWRAWDGVLARHVALHLIPEDDERAPRLLEAARRSATLHDARLLRVLDADVVDGLCYVVNEWGEGESLDIMVEDGPLTPRRAAWIAGEVGTLLVAAHEHGIAHGRLVPENVLVDESGAVKVIGLAVDAALHGLPTTRTSADVIDLAGVLYAAMTGRWAGASQSRVPPAPREHGTLLRPRRVRAGVPRVLDALCDQVLSPEAGNGHRGPVTARDLTDALLEYVGDPAAAAEAEAARHRGGTSTRLPRVEEGPVPGPEETAVLPAVGAAGAAAAVPATPAEPDSPAVPDRPDGPADRTDGPDAGGPDAAGDEGAGDDADDGAAGAAAAAGAAGAAAAAGAAGAAAAGAASAPQPGHAAEADSDSDSEADADRTQAGVPVFYDEITDVGWMSSDGNGTPPPPPPFEEAPERPLFAPDPPEGRPARVSRAGGAAETSAGGGTHGTGTFWPWDGGPPATAEPEEDEPATVPGRSWLRIAAVVALAVVVLIAMAYAFDRGRDGGLLGGGDEAEPSAPPTTDAERVRVDVTDFDPQGDPPTENPDLVPLAVDGDASTAWSTSTYDQNLGPQGLKTGVGLLLDLGEVQDVVQVQLTFTSAPTAVELWVSEDEVQPTTLDGLTRAVQGRAGSNRLTLDLEEPTSSRWVVVWLTSLPQVEEGGFRGQIAEVVVRA